MEFTALTANFFMVIHESRVIAPTLQLCYSKNPMKNPLLDSSILDDKKAFPFAALAMEHYAPAFEAGIQEAKKNIEILANSTTTPTFENTLEAIEFHRDGLGQVAAVFFNLELADTNDAMQALAKEIAPKLAELSNDLLLNDKIFARVKAVYDQHNSLKLSTEEAQLLDKTYKAFVRNGAKLSVQQKEQLREIDRKIALLGQNYSENVLKSTNEYILVVNDKNDLKGLPASVIEEAASTAEEKGKKGAWVFTLQFPSVFPFLQFAENEKLRKEIWHARMSVATQGATDNRSILKDIACLRFERAKLLGYKTHAHFVLEERMASNPERVQSFLQKLLKNSKAAALKDIEDLRSLKEKLTGEKTLNPWDLAFYTEKLKMERYNLSDEELRPYFPLNQVVEGVFEHARLLYGIRFLPRKDISVYHPDVQAYEVKDDASGKFIGLFYADFFPRASKKSGAWMTTFREQGLQAGKVLRPHASIVCNFTKPTASQPSLLNLDEVRTLFHEFGHALHGLLSDCKYVSTGGTNVYWDFVELPSQIMENWAQEKEGLALFARNYKTGEKIPDSLVEKIKKAATFQAGMNCIRQLSFGLLDLAWHAGDPTSVKDVEELEESAMAATRLLPKIKGTLQSPSFSHIFAGGYSAGYYSYKWAEVLDADAFEFFKEKGLFNREVAMRFRENVLSKGGTEHPMELYKRFRGREPDENALLRRDGLL